MQYFAEFYEWLENDACEHKRGEALCHYVGNIALVAFLREELRKAADDFPLILGEVIYDGTHCGDYMSVDEVKKMREEVIRLQAVHSGNPSDEKYLREFEKQMKELIAFSVEMEKPIVF